MSWNAALYYYHLSRGGDYFGLPKEGWESSAHAALVLPRDQGSNPHFALAGQLWPLRGKLESGSYLPGGAPSPLYLENHRRRRSAPGAQYRTGWAGAGL